MVKLVRTVHFWAFLLIASGLLYAGAPPSLKTGLWTHTVLRNWDELGFRKLHGKMVYNPAGLSGNEVPLIYHGHRPFVLYLAYAVGRLSGAADNGLPFYLLLSLVAAISIWNLLGSNNFALLIAGATVFSAGYMQ